MLNCESNAFPAGFITLAIVCAHVFVTEGKCRLNCASNAFPAGILTLAGVCSFDGVP